MTRRSFRRWRRNPGIAQPLFSRFDLVLAQNETLASRFTELGAPSAIPAGNLKVDAPPPPVDRAMLERLRPALDGRALLIAASTHEGRTPSSPMPIARWRRASPTCAPSSPRAIPSAAGRSPIC